MRIIGFLGNFLLRTSGNPCWICWIIACPTSGVAAVHLRGSCGFTCGICGFSCGICGFARGSHAKLIFAGRDVRNCRFAGVLRGIPRAPRWFCAGVPLVLRGRSRGLFAGRSLIICLILRIIKNFCPGTIVWVYDNAKLMRSVFETILRLCG